MKIEATYSSRIGDISDSTTLSVEMGLTEPITAEEVGEFAAALRNAAKGVKTEAPTVNMFVDGAKVAAKIDIDSAPPNLNALMDRQGPL